MTAQLLAALIAVESGNQADAIGDNGRAIGCLQIQKACLLDVNRVYGTNFRWPDDCFNRYLSGRICDLYLTHWCGAGASAETMARTWAGGPKGPRKRATVKYWLKVKEKLSE